MSPETTEHEIAAQGYRNRVDYLLAKGTLLAGTAPDKAQSFIGEARRLLSDVLGDIDPGAPTELGPPAAIRAQQIAGAVPIFGPRRYMLDQLDRADRALDAGDAADAAQSLRAASAMNALPATLQSPEDVSLQQLASGIYRLPPGIARWRDVANAADPEERLRDRAVASLSLLARTDRSPQSDEALADGLANLPAARRAARTLNALLDSGSPAVQDESFLLGVRRLISSTSAAADALVKSAEARGLAVPDIDGFKDHTFAAYARVQGALGKVRGDAIRFGVEPTERGYAVSLTSADGGEYRVAGMRDYASRDEAWTRVQVLKDLLESPNASTSLIEGRNFEPRDRQGPRRTFGEIQDSGLQALVEATPVRTPYRAMGMSR